MLRTVMRRLLLLLPVLPILMATPRRLRFDGDDRGLLWIPREEREPVTFVAEVQCLLIVLVGLDVFEPCPPRPPPRLVGGEQDTDRP